MADIYFPLLKLSQRTTDGTIEPDGASKQWGINVLDVIVLARLWKKPRVPSVVSPLS